MLRSRSARLAAIALLVILVAALLVPAVALARAGGGQSSNPGFSGGGFSGGSSGGGGGAALGGFLLGSALNNSGSSGGGCCTFIFIVIIIVVVYIVITRYFGPKGKGAGADLSAVGDLANIFTETPSGIAAQSSFEQLKAADPNFSEQAFYGRVNEMFMAIQNAWEARNMEPARRFLAEQQFDVLNDGVQELVKNGQVNKLDGLHVDRITPVTVAHEGDSDYVKVMVTATVIDYTVDERTGQIVNPSALGDGKTPKTFDEYWTLVRRTGAQTKSDATIKKCPNCGAPVTDGNYVKCAYCGTMMNDPALDWVLLRIEQP
jgi:hypothetical protein